MMKLGDNFTQIIDPHPNPPPCRGRGLAPSPFEGEGWGEGEIHKPNHLQSPVSNL